MLRALGPLLMETNRLTGLLASLAALLLVAVHFFYQHKFKYFERQGLKNPKPLPVLGNMLASMSKRRSVHQCEWSRKYGKLYGVFEGAKPRYVVADAELLRQISIKDFDAFPNHEASKLLHKYQRGFIVFAQDDHWKRLRALQSPTFTSGKIKRMYKLLQRCATDLADCFGEQLEVACRQDGSNQGAVVNLKETFGLYTMDGIASCAYGLKMERQKGTTGIKGAAARQEFVSMAVQLFKFNLIRVMLTFMVPERLLVACGFTLTPASRLDPIARLLRTSIESRRKSGKKFDDYLQLLLDAKLGDTLELDELDSQENHHAGLTHESLLGDQERNISDVRKTVIANNGSKARLSDEDILGSALVLLVVGFETTSTLLTNCTYALAHHPQIQEKLYEALEAIANQKATNEHEMFDYETLTSCEYLDAVVCETLRLLSPVLNLDRVAKRDYYVEKYDVTIPKGAKLLLAFHAVMNDPDYWPQPEVFKPDRFLVENRAKIVPGSYCPFGLGPRHCLGMRFSLTEAKLGLATVMMRYKFEPAPGTQFPCAFEAGLGMANIERPQAIIRPRVAA